MKKLLLVRDRISCFVFLMLFSIISIETVAQEITDGQKDIIKAGLVEFLTKYQQAGQLTKDGINLDQDYIAEFNSFFEEDKFKGIHDDLSPEGKTKFPTFSSYITFIRINYPQGVDQSFDLANLEIIEISRGKGIIHIILKVRKQLTGLYKRTELHVFDDILYFFVNVPEVNADNITNYKISRIASLSGFNRFVANRASKGLYSGLAGGFDVSQIYNETVYAGDIWTYKPGKTINPALEIAYMFTNGFGIGTGFRMTEYRTPFNIKGFDERSGTSLQDIDNDTYFPVLSISDLTESNSIRCYEIPVIFKTRAGKGNVKLTFDIGMLISLVNESYYTLDGSMQIAGYYPAYDVILSDLPEYNYGNYTYSPSTRNEMVLPDRLYSAYTSLGLSINAGRALVIRIGGRGLYGLTDIGFSRYRHSGDFNITISDAVSTTILRSAGVELGISYKIF